MNKIKSKNNKNFNKYYSSTFSIVFIFCSSLKLRKPEMSSGYKALPSCGSKNGAGNMCLHCHVMQEFEDLPEI
jgi:hypothetical protein